MDMDTNTENWLFNTESVDIDNDYTTHDPLHNPEQALPCSPSLEF